MTAKDTLQRGREAFERRSWGDAYAGLSSVDRAEPLGLEDLERLAVAAYLTGRDEESARIWERAHHEGLRRGDAVRAARCAFWLGFGLVNRGEMAQGSGWLMRAGRLLDEAGEDCVERGYVLLPAALQNLAEGDAKAARETFDRVGEIADRFEDPDLATLSRLGRGHALIRLGEPVRGVALLDEAMVAVTAGEVSPIVVGVVYCSVIELCHELFDLRRAQEWTAALTRWCDEQPDLVPYRGQCLVYRAEVMQLHGAWPEAADEALRACEDLAGQPAVGMAHYTRAELHRLRGDLAEAEEEYRAANEWGRTPQPGLALLRLGQGRIDAAVAAIRRALDEAKDRVDRSRLLAAHVEVMLAAGDVPAARAGADELAEIADDLQAHLLHAVSAQAAGAVLLAEGDARAALDPLRRAGSGWRDLEAPYEAARTRVLIGLACRKLGDEDTAEMELEAARRALRELSAAPDLARLEELARPDGIGPSAGLTGREVQVLRLVASGKTNRAIAHELTISEKTVARHMSNIFAKLGLASRSAATAYAYEHDLV